MWHPQVVDRTFSTWPSGHHDASFTLSVYTSAIGDGSAQKRAAIAGLETLFQKTAEDQPH